MLGEVLVVLGWLVCLSAIVARCVAGDRDRKFVGLLLWSILGCIVAAVGFYSLVVRAFGSLGDMVQVAAHGMSEMVTVLALLTAGAFAGFCAVDFQKAAKDETAMLNVISALFTTVLFLLFFALAYCVGTLLPAAEDNVLRFAVSAAMGLLLASTHSFALHSNPHGGR